MIYRNAQVFTENGFVHGGFAVEDGVFTEVFSGERDGGRDLHGAHVIPGLVDIHTHGAAGADFSDGDAEGLRRMAAHLAACGVTSFCPTSMTLPYETLAAAFQTAAQLRAEMPGGCARVAGIHMEEAIRAATIRPAREIGRESEIGSIEAGKLADFVVCDERLVKQEVYIGGVKV